MTTESNRVYDEIGAGYAGRRRTDRRWESQIHAAVQGAARVLNVGAGAGSYEPTFAQVVAVEPSVTMIAQRSAGAAPVVQAVAEQLPFADRSFDVAMAILTTHNWSDAAAGLRELQRVARRQLIITWDPAWFARHFWLVRDYLPQLGEMEKGLATMAAVAATLDVVNNKPLPVPADCTDGFFGAFWKRPRAYLDASVRASISGLALLDQGEVDTAMARLAQDLDSGAWYADNHALQGLQALDLGYRLLICGQS
jgi:hypothetical protein